MNSVSKQLKDWRDRYTNILGGDDIEDLDWIIEQVKELENKR